MPWPEPVTLRSDRVTLEPLGHGRRDELIEAVRDGELWRFGTRRSRRPRRWRPRSIGASPCRRRARCCPFTVVDGTAGKAAGMTTYMNIDAPHRRVEIGSTWYRKGVQRTDLNTHCKLLLLTHAFETLDCIAVEFRTHFFNQQSRRGIERLGAKLDGILRCHQISAERHAARHLRLQHHRRRMADGEGAPHVAAGEAEGVAR